MGLCHFFSCGRPFKNGGRALDVVILTDDESVKVITFNEPGGNREIALRYNSNAARVVTEFVKKRTGFKFKVVHGVMNTNISVGKFTDEMKDLEIAAKKVALPFTLSMNATKYRSISAFFLKSPYRSSDSMETGEDCQLPHHSNRNIETAYADPHGSKLAMHSNCVPRWKHERLQLEFEKLKRELEKTKDRLCTEQGVVMDMGEHADVESVAGSSMSDESGAYSASDSISTDGSSIEDPCQPTTGGRRILTPKLGLVSGKRGPSESVIHRTSTAQRRKADTDFEPMDCTSYKKLRREHSTSTVKTAGGVLTEFKRETPKKSKEKFRWFSKDKAEQKKKYWKEKYFGTLNTSLHIASKEGKLGTVENILSSGFIFIDCKGDSGKTPVMLAAEHGHRDVLDFLVKHGCDLSVDDDEGNNILHAACLGRNPHVIEAVIGRPEVDKNASNNAGSTPLKIAEGYSRKIYNLLKDRGCE